MLGVVVVYGVFCKEMKVLSPSPIKGEGILFSIDRRQAQEEMMSTNMDVPSPLRGRGLG